MKPGLLVIQRRSPHLLEAIAREYSVFDYGRADDPDGFVIEVGDEVRAMLTNGRGGAGAGLIARLPRLEIICCFGVGYEMVDLESCRSRGITLTNAPGTNDVGVAEMAILLMLAVTRNLSAADKFVKQGARPEGDVVRTHTIGGKRLGIVGLGRIGRKIADRAAGFEMEIAWHGPNEKPDAPWRYFPELGGLIEWADYLVLACPGGEATRHLISAPELRALGASGILVNVARGTVVDPDALIAALDGGIIGGAGLDVFEGEPHLPAAIRIFDNVTLTPHMGAITHEALENGRELLLANLRAHFAGEPVPTPVLVAGGLVDG
jgi:lactate dehydrogenase-like 2-hydroxyacid dehydrogenase